MIIYTTILNRFYTTKLLLNFKSSLTFWTFFRILNGMSDAFLNISYTPQIFNCFKFIIKPALFTFSRISFINLTSKHRTKIFIRKVTKVARLAYFTFTRIINVIYFTFSDSTYTCQILICFKFISILTYLAFSWISSVCFTSLNIFYTS